MIPVLATRVNQVAAGRLDVGCVDVGPPDGPAVVLLHGWPYVDTVAANENQTAHRLLRSRPHNVGGATRSSPYDIRNFAEVLPLLAATSCAGAVKIRGGKVSSHTSA